MAISLKVRLALLIRRNALKKGLFGGNQVWLAIGAFVWGRKFVKKTFGRNEEYVTTETLTRGNAVRIEAIGPGPRREQRGPRREQGATRRGRRAARRID